MSFLKDQIREQHILEMEVDFEAFIKDKEISDSAMIFQMTFDKDVFKEEVEVREYLKDKYFYEPIITETEAMFIADVVNQSQMDFDSEVIVELRRGVIARAADFMPLMSMEEVQFNEKGEVNLSAKLGTINLSAGMPHIIEIAKVAEGDHPAYGKLKITEQHLQSMVDNFKAKVAGVDLAVNEDHQKNGAFGWFKDVFLSYDKQTLYGQIRWNTKGTQALSEKEYRYFSPEFRFNYVHPHTGIEHGTTLLGGALTNYPFLKMEAITELSNKNQSQGETIVSTETQINLSEHNATVVDLNGKISEIQGKLDAAEARTVELNSKVETLEKEKQAEAQKVVHQKLFADNKISAAQLVALNEGKNMLEVLALGEKLNTTPAGHSDSTEEVNLSEEDKSMAKKLGLTEEEYAKYNKEL